MKRYRWLRRWAAWFLVAEFVVGMGGFLTPRGEIFPFASWFLFVLVPAQADDYDLVLTAEGTRRLDPPLPFSQAPGRLVIKGHSIVSYQVIQELGEAQRRGDDARVRALRHQIESQFNVPAIRYDLVRVTYQPVERWLTGRVSRRTPLASFLVGDYPPAAPVPAMPGPTAAAP